MILEVLEMQETNKSNEIEIFYCIRRITFGYFLFFRYSKKPMFFEKFDDYDGEPSFRYYDRKKYNNQIDAEQDLILIKNYFEAQKNKPKIISSYKI